MNNKLLIFLIGLFLLNTSGLHAAMDKNAKKNMQNIMKNLYNADFQDLTKLGVNLCKKLFKFLN
jgi:hypothetical protein